MYRRQAAIPILALGDSYTYGEEVNNGETWPSILQALTGRKVLNAGVAGYGFDQIVLRAGLLAPTVHPVGDRGLLHRRRSAAHREASRLWSADKPWFEIDNGELVLRGVPVPPRTDPRAHARRAAVGASGVPISWISCCAGST